MSELSKKVYSLNLGVPEEFEDMSAYSAYLGNGVVGLELHIKKMEAEIAGMIAENNRIAAERDRLREVAERLEVLAVKWVDAGHHDWPEIKALSQALKGGDMSKLSDKVYKLNLGVPKYFEDMSAYSAYLGNGVVELEQQVKELEAQAKHWEDTCHAQWESSQQSVDDCNRLTKENQKLREALQMLINIFDPDCGYSKKRYDAVQLAKQALKGGRNLKHQECTDSDNNHN